MTAVAPNQPAKVRTSSIVNRSTSTSYGTDGKCPLVTTNALGHQEEREYDPRFGTVTKLTGPNGLVTRWEYDALGRKTKEIRADGSQTGWHYLLCGTCAPENLGKYWVMTQPTDSPPVTTVHDSLGREVLWATYGFNGQYVYKDTRYDALGNVLKGSRKYFPGSTVRWTSFLYDKLGRVTRETGADGSRVDTAYDKLCTTATAYPDAASPGQVTTRCRSTQDQIISVVDATQQTTTYAYDGFGNLVRTVDPHGNQTVMTYDVRGRKIEMVDPDLGRWTYVYDSLGQLLEQVSPKERDAGQKTAMTYDKLGRMLTRSDADGSSTWIYDTSPGGTGIGKLWKVARAGGDYEREHLYDDKGRPSEVRTTIEGETFSIATEYEATNSRVKKVVYPGGAFAVAHSYTTWGYLKDVKDATSGALYWKGETADADGNFTLETLGNGAQTARGYDALSGMLSSISTAKAGAPSLQELRYAFDPRPVRVGREGSPDVLLLESHLRARSPSESLLPSIPRTCTSAASALEGASGRLTPPTRPAPPRAPGSERDLGCARWLACCR